MNDATVSVIVPAHAEANWIDACLDRIERQDYPHDRLEVIVVVDGASTDHTEQRARARLATHDYKQALVVRNGGRGTPSNLNTGLALATGDIVCRVDARSLIEPDYVRLCVEVLAARPEVSVVGGTPIAVPGDEHPEAFGIARAFNNAYAMGWSRHHRAARSGPSDTVYLGAFRTAELVDAGGWNERFPTNQDFELNRRMAKRGVVWFDDRLEVGYVTRTTVLALHRHFTRFGRAKVHYWRTTGDRPRPRQLVMLAGPPVAGGLLSMLYLRGGHRRRAAIAAALVAGGWLVETRGSARPHGGPAVHAWSAVALVAAVGGWLRGVWSELLRGGR